jgi:hypothetical protein
LGERKREGLVPGSNDCLMDKAGHVLDNKIMTVTGCNPKIKSAFADRCWMTTHLIDLRWGSLSSKQTAESSSSGKTLTEIICTFLISALEAEER